MDNNKNKIELSQHLSLEFKETVKINNSNIDKFKVGMENDENVKTNLNDYYVYIESNLDENNLDKNKLNEYIENSISTNPNESNIFIDSIKQFCKNESIEDQDSSDSSRNSGGGHSASKSYGKQKLEFYNPDTFKYGINLKNSEKLGEAVKTINNASECISGMENLLNRMRGFFPKLDKSCSSIKNGINDVGLKLANITKWHSIDSVVDLYKNSFISINEHMLECQKADIEMAVAAGAYILPNTILVEGGKEVYDQMQADVNKEVNLLLAELTPDESGLRVTNSVYEVEKRLNAIRAKYFPVTETDILIFIGATSGTDGNSDVNGMTNEQMLEKSKQSEAYKTGMFNAVSNTGMSRDFFDNCLMNDAGLLAKELASAAALEVVNAYKGTETEAGKTYEGVLDTKLNNMVNDYYCTSEGQEAFYRGFISNKEYDINDEYNAIANTEYVKYCIAKGKQNEWLKPELRGLAETINRLDNYDKFSTHRVLDPNNPLDADILKTINDCEKNSAPLPYGIKFENGKYTITEYTNLGQELLYYMDYHYAENTWNKGENRFITSFSNQGYVDAIERGYKNAWIESRIGTTIDKIGVKQSDAYKNAERDYYILSGNITDPNRKKELKKEGELSFSDLVKCVNAADGDIKNLLNQEYVDAHKDEFAEILDSNSLWDFSVQRFNFSDNKILNLMTNSAVDVTAKPIRDTFSKIVALGQVISGIAKWCESSLFDATNTFFHSDAFLSEYQTVDDDGNMSVDTSELNDSYKKLYDKCWEEYRATGKYEEDFQKFFESSYWKSLVEKAVYLPEFGKYYIEGIGNIDSLDNETLENEARRMFGNNKAKEWSVLDSSSSNQVTAAFKMGIRNGGDFSYLDNNISETIKSAADKQFETKLKVSVDNVGNFYENYVYSNDIYKFIEDNSIVKHDNILGIVANQIGNMAIPVGISMIPGLAPSVLGAVAPAFKALSSAALFTSAFGGSAEEAFNSGASYNEALEYATESAITELAIELVFGGIGGYGEGWADKLIEAGYDKIFPKSEGSFAKIIKQLVTGGLGEAVEEVATDFVTPIWQSMTYMNEKSYSEILSENVSLESLVQTAVVSFLSSMVFKGVEIKQQNSTYNKNYSKLTDAIEKISGDKLDSSVMKKISDKVFGKYIDGIIENEGVIPSGLLEQLIKTASKELLTANPEYAQELGKLQEQLKSFSDQKITIGEGKNSISITGSELLKLEDFTGLDGKYAIEDGKIKFENEEAQNRFNNKVFEMAQNQTDGYNSKLSDLVSNLRKAKDSLIIDERKGISGLIDKISNIVFENDKVAIGGIESAVAVITELGNITNTGETVLLEHNGSIIQIPKAILSEVTTKLSIEDSKIKFNKDMNSGKFIQKLYDKAIKLCNEKISKNSYDIEKIVNKGLINKAIDAIKPSLTQSDSPITVMNSTKVSENNLTRYDIKFDFLGISKNVSVYIEGNTDATALNQVDKVKELIQTAILFSGNTSNIYLGQLVYDAKTKEINSIKNNSNLLYVESLELEANKTSGNMYKLQNVINSLIAINGNLKNSENVTIQKDGKNISIPKSLLEEITSKYKIVDGKVEFTKSMSVEKFISAVYDKAISLNNNAIVGINNTTIKNSSYVNVDNMDLYKLEVETIIDGVTKTFNVYVDGNTDISSLKDSTKISQMLYQLLYENKNSNNVYVGQIVYDEKTGKINVSENISNKLYVDGLNKTSESNNKVDVVVNEETSKSKEMDSEDAKSGEIEKGESYEYNVEEINEDDSTTKPKETVEAKEKPANIGGESVITNVVETASVAATAGATSQAIYQNNVESSSVKDTSKAKNISPKSNTQVKENAHVETSNNSIINISEVKSQVNSYIDSIKTECEKYIEMHKNDENFEHRFEQFKRDKIMKLNDKLSEVRKAITDSNSAELNAINEKINSLSESDSLRNELISQRDKLIEKQQQELSDIENTAREKLQKVFSELNIEEKTESSSEELIDINNEKPVIVPGSHNIDLSQIHSSEELIDVLTQTNSLEANEQRDKENLAYFIEFVNRNPSSKEAVMRVDDRVSNCRNSGIILDNTFDDGGSGVTISGIDLKKLLPKDWYEYRGSADYRITMANSSNMNPYDAISYINTLVEEANKRGLNLRAKNYWEKDAFILYLQKGDLLETVKMLEDLKDSSKYGVEVSRATQSFGAPMPFGATISDNPYYAITMAQYEDKYSPIYSRTYGKAAGTFNGHIEYIFKIAYDKMLEKYNGDTSKITVDEFYDLMYEEHKKIMEVQSDENIPFWMAERNYREYIESKTELSSIVTNNVSQESKNDSDASLKNDMRTDSNVADVSSKISMRTDPNKAKASLEKMNKTSIDSSSMDNNIDTTSQVTNNAGTMLETNDNLEVIKVDETNKSSKIVMTRTKFDMNKSYDGYEYVVKPKTDLLTAINEIKSGNFGNVLIEIPNTLELTQEVVENIPSNVEVRITGGYTLEFLNAKGLKSPLVTGVSSLQHTTYTASELRSIVSELSKFDSLVDPSWSDSKKAQFVYEYLRDNIEYHGASEIVGGNQTRAKYYDGLMNLVQRQSTCQGFAYTYNALLERLNVKSYVVSGSLNGVGQHVFNVVEIDGKLVVVDSTRELLNSNKHTGTGFNPNSVFEYVFNSYDNLENQLVKDTLIDLLTPSNLENALKTGEYRGVSVEAVLSELSRIDGVNLDSKLQELVRISETLSENEVIFNREGVYFGNAEPLILTKDFVNTLTLEQKEFLTQISTEGGLIEYLQNNTLTKVELLERSELSHTDNKYVNKLIELISENQQTTKQIYNVMDVVRNNSNPIFIESTYKGDTHTLSTNEVLDFMETGKVDTKYSYSDYVKATNKLMNDLASQKAKIEISEETYNIINKYNDLMSSNRVVINIDEVMANPDITPITLPKTINGIDSNVVYRYLTDSEMLNNLLNGNVTDVNVPQLVSALKTLTSMSDSLGLEMDSLTKMNIDSLYIRNMEDSYVQVVESRLPNIYFEFKEILRNCNGSYQLAISEFEKMGHDIDEVVISLLSNASSNAHYYENSRAIYDYSYDYLISKGYTQNDAAIRVASIYKKLLDARGYDTLIEKDGIKIHVQKGVYWPNQPYTLDYIQKELGSIRKMYKTNIPVDVYVYDTFNPYDKYWEIQYNMENFHSAATGGYGVINIYDNPRIDSTTLSHEYGHLLDTQIMNDNNSVGRISESQEYLDAISKDNGAPTAYAKTNCREDFAESVAHMRKNPIEFKNKFPNRYEFLSKYISVETSVDVITNANIATETTIQNSTVDSRINTAFENMVYKFGIQESFEKLCEYVRTGNIDVFTEMDDVRKNISSVDKNTIIKYLNENFGEEIVNEYIGLVDEGIDTRDVEATMAGVRDVSSIREGNVSNTVINNSQLAKFDIVIDGKVENTLNLEELISNGYKISDCYELMEESQYDEFNSAIVNYIDYVKNNNIQVEIDSNVMKFYESYKYAKENNVFIVNEDRILGKGADMVAIPQEIYNKYQNDLTYQVVINTIINSVESLDNFEKFIKNLYLVNEKYRNCTNNIINSIDSSLRTNENFNAVYNVISKLSEHTMSDNTLCLANVYDMIYKNAEPIYLPNYINGEFRDGHQAIKTDILLDTILGKNQFPISYNSNIIENCRKLYNYLQSNNITLNENIMEKLEFVNGLNENQIILNISEYFDGNTPIVATEFIKIQDAQISSLDIMEILKMDSDAYIKLLRDGICEFNDIKSDNLILSIQRLLSQNQILSELYNDNYIKLKDLYDNSYVLKNTLSIVPKTFNEYYTSLIDTILNNPNFINSYSVSEKQNLINVINDFIEYLKSNNVEIEYSRYEKVLEFLNRKVPNIDSSIAIKSEFALELETNEKNGGTFGSDQGILRRLLKKTKMNTVIEKLFGNNIETKKLLEVLNQMNISDEEFTRQLLKTNRGLLFTKNTTEIKMIEDLANQVMKNYPGMSKKEAIQFLYLMEAYEGSGGICNYASMVNLIFNKYMNNPSLFEEKLGYPMYVTIDGKRQLNTATLLVDLYSIINEDVLVTKENGVYKIAVSNAEYLNLTNADGTIAMEYFQKFLDKKGIDMDVSKTFTYNSDTELMHYEELITNIHDALARGEHVHLSAWNFDICRPNGSTAGMDVGGHIMSVLEITKDGHLIVDSWGERFMIDLKSQMSKTGNYSSSSKICVVSYDISFDNNANVSNSLDTNTDVNNDRNTHNSAHIEVFDVPSDSIKSNVTSSVITDEDLKFIDEGINTRDIEAPMASAQDMLGDAHSAVSNIINIDGVEITVETLKELQTPSNLENALKTGEYAGVRVEKALVELSKLDGVTLDSKLQKLVDVSSKLSDNHVIFNIEKVYHDGATAFVLPQEFLNELTVEEKDLLSRETKFITQISNSKLDAKELIRGVNDQLFRDILSEITTQIKEDSQEFFREWQITNEKDKGEKFIKYDYKKIREQYPIFRGNEYNKFANTVNKIKEDIDIKTKILEKYSEYINKEGKDLRGYGLDKKKQKPYKKNINSSINGLLYQKNIVLEHVSETEFVRAILSPEYEHIKKYARWFKNKKTAIMLNEMIQRNYRIKNAAADIRYDIQKDAAYMLYDIQKEIILKEQETIVEVKFDDGRTVSVKSLFNPIVFDSMKLDNLIKQLDGLYSWPVRELFISDAFCPSNFIAQIQLKTRKIFIANHSLDLNSKTSYIWDGNLTEERIIYKFAEAMVREIAITKPEMIEIWEGVISRDNSFVSEHAKNDLLIDMTESIAAAIMDPGSLDENGYHPGIFGQQFPERNKLILEGYGRDKVKLIDISRLNGLPTKLYDVNKKINSVSYNSKVVLKDTKNVSNSLILDDSDISYEMKHLLYEGKLIIRDGQPIIYGAHNMQHFDDLVRDNSNLKISGVTPHPSIRGISNVEYYLTDANGNIIGRANFPKTVYDPSVISDEKILKLRDEALRNGTFVDSRSKIGMATNGLLFQAYYVDGRLDSGFPFATSEMAGIEKFMSQFKLPVTINGRTQYVDVSIDGETDPIVISQYGPKLIKYVESLIKENGYTYKTGDIICLDELRYDSTTDSIISVTTTNGNMNIINDTFEVYDGSELKNTLNLRELIGKNTDLFNSYSSISEEHRSELLDKIVEYVDYVKQYRSDIEIDANVEKFYNAYMSTKQNNLHIVNVENIIKNGSDMLAISEDLYVECQNKPLCNELVSKIANGIDSIDAYEQLIKNQVERLVLDTETKQKILQGIDLNVNNNENLKTVCEVLSKIDFDIMKGDNSYVYNLHEMFSQNADPIYLPYDFSDLLQYIVGKGKFNISQIESIIKQSKLLNNYLQSNNIVLNENIMEKLEFISKLNDNQIISNLQEYFDEQNPIVVNKYTKFGKTEISTLKIIEFLEMKSDLYIEFLRDANTKYLFDSINKLFKSNPELSELYKANFEKIKALHKSSYIINDSTVIVSNTFGKYKTSFLDNIVNNPNQLYKYNKAERQNIINAINELSEYLSNNGLITDYNSQLLEFVSRDVPKIDSSIEIKSPLYKIFKRNGRVFGADQGAVRKVIENSKIDVLIQFVQGRYIGTDKFLQTLNEMNISEERFRKMLETSSRGFIFTNGDVKISELANLVIKNYPGMSGKDAVQFLHLLETEEAGGRGICNYASMANLIFDKYKNNIKLFEEHFGYPMYIEVNGKQRLNTSMLLVDMYSIINEGELIKYENGIYKVEISNEYYNNLTTNDGTIAMGYFQTFLDKKGINFNISEEFRYNSFNTNNIMHYEEVITNIHDALARGEHVHLSSGGFNLYYPNGIIASKNVGSHIMSVVGITSDGKLIVDSWGQELIFNLEEQMSRVGELYKSHAHKYQKYIQLVSYNISMDGSENINNQSQSLNNSHINNTSSLEVFDVPSPKAKSSLGSVPYRNTLDELLDSSRVERGTTNSISLDDSSASNTEATGYDYTVEISKPSKTNTTVTAEDLVFIDEVKDVSAPDASIQDVQSNVDSDLVSTVNIDGKEIEVEKLKELQTPNNLGTALKTGVYQGVRIEKALVELSKLEGVTLDSKLQELVKVCENLNQDEIILNLVDVYSKNVQPMVTNENVYKEYIKTLFIKNINGPLKTIYDIFSSKKYIYKLLSNEIISSNFSNEKIINLLKIYINIAENNGYSNAMTSEIKYYLDILTNSSRLDRNIFYGYDVKTLEILLNNPNKINGYDMSRKKKVLKALDEYSKYIKNKYPSHYSNYANNIEFLTKSTPNVDSKIAFITKIMEIFDNNGQVFGAKQGAVREILINTRTSDVIEFLCKNKSNKQNFMEKLNDANFTDEKFKQQLLKINDGNTLVTDDIEMLNTFIEQVKTNYPGMATKNALQFLYLMETVEGSVNGKVKGICNYASMVNLIFDMYQNSPSLFEEHMGYPMYITINGKQQLNTTRLLVDMYSIINEGELVKGKQGSYKVELNNLGYLNLSDKGKVLTTNFDKFLKKKGIKMSLNETFAYNSYDTNNMMHYEEVIINIHDCLVRGEHVHISADLFNLYNMQGKLVYKNGGSHIMSVVGITEDGNLIVDSWGKKLVFNLKEQMTNCGEVRVNGVLRNKRVNIVSYNISLDNSSNISTNSNSDGNINNGTNTQTSGESINSPKSSVTSTIDTDLDVIGVSDKTLKHDNSIIEDADVDMAFPKKSIFSKKIETVSVSDIPRVFRNMNTTDIISILEGKTTLKNDENFINNKRSIIRFVKYLSENNIKLSLNERANTIIENLRNGDFRLNILNFSDVLNGDTPIYGPSSINLDGIRISTDDVMVYLENKKNEISSIITSDTPNQDARDLLNAIDELGSKNDIIYDKYRKSIKLIERIERSYLYRSYDSYYLLPMSFNGIDTSNILNSDILSLTSYINSLSNADKKAYRVALDEFGKYIYKSNTRLSKQDLSRVNKLYDVINTKKFRTDTVIKSKVYDTFEMSYQNDGEFGSNQGKVREVIEKLGITNVIESLFNEKVERSKFLQTLSEFNISERDFITALTKKIQIGIMNNLFKDGDINLELYSSLIKQVKINYPNMSTMEAVRFLYLIETKEAGGPGICNNPIFVNMIFDRYIGREIEFERDFGYPMYITSNNGKKVLNEARLLVDIYSTLNDGVLVHNINGKYMIQTTNVNYVRTYDLNGLRLDAIEKFINKKGINLNLSKSYFFNSNEELMHYDYLMEQIKSELDKGNYVILGARGFDMDVENFEFREDCDAHGMTVVGIDTTGELILDSWGMKARVDLKKELSRVNELFKNSSDNMAERIFTISSYNIS